MVIICRCRGNGRERLVIHPEKYIGCEGSMSRVAEACRPLAADLDPPGTEDRVDAERHEAESHDSEQERPVRLMDECLQGTVEALRLLGVELEGGAHHEETEQNEDHATGSRPKSTDLRGNVYFFTAHLARLE